jgi:type VI secretion system protein ImpA
VPDGEQKDFSARLARLNWLASDRGGLLPSVRAIGFAGNSDKRSDWLSWEAHLSSERVGRAAATNQDAFDEMVAAGQTTPEQWSTALGVTSSERIREEALAARACEKEARAIEALSEQRIPDGAANLNGLTALLAEIAEFLEARLPSESDASVASDGTSVSPGRSAAGLAGGAVASRAAALARLSEVARFFRETEPHSPVSRLVERAVRWGNMTFEDVLRDVVKNDSALNEIWDTLGVKPPESNS